MNPANSALFNGKDLTGWVTPEDKSLFVVEEGEIVGRTKGDLKKNEFLVTDEAVRRFRAEGQGQDSERQLGNSVSQQARG